MKFKVKNNYGLKQKEIISTIGNNKNGEVSDAGFEAMLFSFKPIGSIFFIFVIFGTFSLLVNLVFKRSNYKFIIYIINFVLLLGILNYFFGDLKGFLIYSFISIIVSIAFNYKLILEIIQAIRLQREKKKKEEIMAIVGGNNVVLVGGGDAGIIISGGEEQVDLGIIELLKKDYNLALKKLNLIIDYYLGIVYKYFLYLSLVLLVMALIKMFIFFSQYKTTFLFLN